MPILPRRTGPLVGLKVLEIGHYVAAPFCTRILADLGAEVIKIEPPGGDPFRGWGAAVDGNSVWFSIHGRNKLSVVLDLKRERATALKLAARADVLVENLRAGQLERLGLGPEVLHAGESAPGDRAHLRLRPGRAVSRPPGVRRDRRGDGRAAPPDRASAWHLRPAAAALRHLDQRRPGGTLCRDRAAGGAVAARCLARARAGADTGTAPAAAASSTSTWSIPCSACWRGCCRNTRWTGACASRWARRSPPRRRPTPIAAPTASGCASPATPT